MWKRLKIVITKYYLRWNNRLDEIKIKPMLFRRYRKQCFPKSSWCMHWTEFAGKIFYVNITEIPQCKQKRPQKTKFDKNDRNKIQKKKMKMKMWWNEQHLFFAMFIFCQLLNPGNKCQTSLSLESEPATPASSQ